MASSGQRTGIANLPLHYGKVPPWLFRRMSQLAREITTVTVAEFGTTEMLRRLSDPYWFQAFRLHPRLRLAFQRRYDHGLRRFEGRTARARI